MANPIPDTAEWYLDEYDAERFWAHVNQRGGTPYASDPIANATGQCWLWNGAHSDANYGRFRVFGEWRAAHHISFLDTGNRIPEGTEIDHLCRVHNCVNPAHLQAVSHATNMARGARAKRTHCKHGHEYTEANTRMVNRSGTIFRMCRTCRRDYARAMYIRRTQTA